MRIMAINGSPRKEWNTASMLKNALLGASSKGAETELVHLYDLCYKGCVSCFACKEKGGKSFGTCAIKDDLSDIFKKVEASDAVILGSPVYLGSVTGEMQSFLERLIFPYLEYTDPPGTLFPKKIPTGFIYTMGIPESGLTQFGYDRRFAATSDILKRIFGSNEMVCSFDTYQFEDHSKVHAPRFDPALKKKRRDEIFPLDLRKAFDLGVRFAAGV
ncbi:MAG: flavodoxin family protein [Candidatus Omnitrophica bacterium]|nr:flavodoxin family protein [Candidatus Omnitrophota bacterium]